MKTSSEVRFAKECIRFPTDLYFLVGTSDEKCEDELLINKYMNEKLICIK